MGNYLSVLTLIRRFLLLFVFACIGQNVYADVPIIAPTSAVPDTCDEDFMGTLKDRAWMEGQREITQNANLVPRPDSVMSMTCFDSFLNDLAKKADDGFPGEAKAGWFAYDYLIIELNELQVDVDPHPPPTPVSPSPGSLPSGMSGAVSYLSDLGPRYTLFGVLELLVLDQLSNDVTAIGSAYDDLVTGGFGAACPTKRHYIDKNFPSLMLGGRAKAKGSWSEIKSGLSEDVSTGQDYTCDVMNEVWMRSKCYDFATESNLNYEHSYTGDEDHDGFYKFYIDPSSYPSPPPDPPQSYFTEADSGKDFRKLPSECHPPTEYGLPPSVDGSDILADVSAMACAIGMHGSLPPPLPSDLFSLHFPLSDSPVWDTAYYGATPNPGDPGALDAYKTFLGLYDPASCADPIETGYKVTRDGSDYPDAVCVTPGCYYDGSGCVNP